MQPQTKYWYLLRSMRHSRWYDFQGHPWSGSRSHEIQLQKWRFSNSVSAIFQPIKKIPVVSDTRPKYLKSLSPDFWISFYLLSSNMTAKFAKKSTSSDLNETWCDVRSRWDIRDDMTFKVIWGQGQGEEMTSVPCWDYFFYFQRPFSFAVVEACERNDIFADYDVMYCWLLVMFFVLKWLVWPWVDAFYSGFFICK